METGIPVGLKQQRDFGLLVGGVLVGAFGLLIPLLRHRPLPLWPWIPGLALLALGLAAPGVLRWPHRLWMGLGAVLGFINTRIILGVIFFVVVTPVGLILRAIGRDPMRRRRCPDSYRVASEPLAPERMKEPF